MSGQSDASGVQTGKRHCEVSCYNLARRQELLHSVDVCMNSVEHSSQISTGKFGFQSANFWCCSVQKFVVPAVVCATHALQGAAKKVTPKVFFAVFSATVWNFYLTFCTFID